MKRLRDRASATIAAGARQGEPGGAGVEGQLGVVLDPELDRLGHLGAAQPGGEP